MCENVEYHAAEQQIFPMSNVGSTRPILCECLRAARLTRSMDQGHTQWGIISHKVKCSESSRDARVDRSLSPAVRRTMPRSDSAHGPSASSPQNTPRGRSRSQGATLRDSRHSYIPRTGCDNDSMVGLPPRPPLYKTSSTKKLSPTKKGTSFW